MPDTAPPSPPVFAVVSNAQTPYRLHVHRRIARELPQVELHSLFTHESGSSAWRFDATPEIRPVLFGAAGSSTEHQGRLSHALADWRRGGQVIRWLADHDARAVLVVGYNDPGRLRLIRWCRRRGIPCFLFGDSNVRGDRATGPKAFLKRRLLRRVLRACAAVLPCGSLGRAYFENYGARPDRIFYFPYEPDYALIQQLPPDQITAVRDRFALTPARRRLLYAGRLVPEKRVDLLLDAFAQIADQRPDWDLLIVGDGPLRATLTARLPHTLTPRVTWTGFVNDPSTLAALYHTADVLVLPSDYEPWGVVVNEAAAAGLALVCTDVVGAAAELLRDNVNGRLFPAGDLPQLVDRLLDVTANPARTDALKSASLSVLADWRTRADPIAGLRQALAASGVIAP